MKIPIYLGILIGSVALYAFTQSTWILVAGLAAFYIVPTLVCGHDVVQKQDRGY